MKTIEIKGYEFDELSDSAKEKARQWWREAASGDAHDLDCTIDEAVEQGGLMGISFKDRQIPLMNGLFRDEASILWSGFWSQGDGACFEGTWSASDVKAAEVADGWGEDPATTEIKRIAMEFDRIAKAYPEASFNVTHSGRYYHEFCTDFTVSLGEGPDGDGCEPTISPEEWSSVADSIIEVARDFMTWIYRQLEKEWEYQNSDEQVDESIRANEYLFTEEGKRSVYL